MIRVDYILSRRPFFARSDGIELVGTWPDYLSSIIRAESSKFVQKTAKVAKPHCMPHYVIICIPKWL